MGLELRHNLIYYLVLAGGKFAQFVKKKEIAVNMK